jgi:hypothetical protein
MKTLTLLLILQLVFNSLAQSQPVKTVKDPRIMQMITHRSVAKADLGSLTGAMSSSPILKGAVSMGYAKLDPIHSDLVWGTNSDLIQKSAQLPDNGNV